MACLKVDWDNFTTPGYR